MSSRVILANVVARLRTLSRERFAMFFTFAFPVILIVVFGIIFTTPQRLPVALHVQDRDGTAVSRQLIENLADGEIVKIVTVPPEEDAAEHARRHDLAFVLIIPEGFERMHTAEPAQPDEAVALTYVYHPHAIAVDERQQFLHTMLTEVNQRLLSAVPFIHADEQPAIEQRRRFLDFFVPGIIAMAMMTASLYGALHISAELRQKGVLRKLAATPITRTEWLLSNVLYQLVLAVISTTAILLVSYLAFRVGLQVNPWLAVYMVLTVVTFVGMGMVIAPFARDAESASAAGNAILFPMMFLSGTFFPVELMPGVLQGIAYILPLYYINEGLRASMLFLDHAAAARYAGITVGFAAVLFVGGVLATRWDEVS